MAVVDRQEGDREQRAREHADAAVVEQPRAGDRVSGTASAPSDAEAARASVNAVVGSAANAAPIVAGSVPQRSA